MSDGKQPLTVYKIRYTTPTLLLNPDVTKRCATEFVSLPNIRSLMHYLNKFVERSSKYLKARIVSVWVSNSRFEDVSIVHLFSKELENQSFITSYKERLIFAAEQKLAALKIEREWKARDRVKEFMIDYAIQMDEEPTVENLTGKIPSRSIIKYRLVGGSKIQKMPTYMPMSYADAVEAVNQYFSDAEVLQVDYIY